MKNKEYSHDDIQKGGEAVLECVRSMAEQVKSSADHQLQLNATEYFREKDRLQRQLTEDERKEVRREMARRSLRCERALAEIGAIAQFEIMLQTWRGDTVAHVIADANKKLP